ncbi:hypothetical protein GCK72_008551 [Caenorhabditis remanei]|uniref:F-box domain-containing protein n=1 Tax=Caenorhabditis remanei TaxID=31234 RepID=A0A6A5H0K6_CAERE|nr:hypothetical protein GCK72_008551 [Caenorhabditis remanei]KAF1760304.1 hypothetical protein GCK72_008551 [Caenorhabditis remanei]
MELTFPLLRLPENVIIKVLKNLWLSQLFKFSLVSSETKNLVTSLGLKASDVDIIISRSIRVAVYVGENLKNHLTLDFYKDSNDQNAVADISLSVDAPFDYEGTRIQTSILFNFSNWLKHIQSLFCLNQPRNVFFYQGCERFQLQSLKDAIGNVNFLSLFNQINVLSREVLKHFNTPSRLFLWMNPFEEACQIQQVFLQNFETIAFRNFFSLDDMLLANSVRVDLCHPISQKQFNQFVKHWIRGSNPRLQCMSLSIDKTDFASGVVYLKGIRCMEMSEDAKKEIREKHKLPVNVDMIQIRRNDGTPAVIVSKDLDDRIHIHLIVLH